MEFQPKQFKRTEFNDGLKTVGNFQTYITGLGLMYLEINDGVAIDIIASMHVHILEIFKLGLALAEYEYQDQRNRERSEFEQDQHVPF